MSKSKKDEHSVVDNNRNRQQLSTKHPWGIEQLAVYLGCSYSDANKITSQSGFPKPFDFNERPLNGHVDHSAPKFNPLEVIAWYKKTNKLRPCAGVDSQSN